MRRLVIAVWLAGCAAATPEGAAQPPAGAPLIADEGLDRPPSVELPGADAIARADLAGAILWVDRERTLHLRDRDGDRVIAGEIGGRPIADAQGSIAAWSEPRDPSGAIVRTLRGGSIETIAEISGAASPIAVIDDRVILVGSENGGVAGIWIAERDRLICVTNCALRAGQPWGDAFVPPPADGSIAIDGETIEYVDATGIARAARIP